MSAYNDEMLLERQKETMFPDTEPKVCCSICDEEIPSDGYYYEFDGFIYCQDCMNKYHRNYVDY